MHTYEDSNKTTKKERIEARITAEQKAIIQRAADVSGRSISDFLLASVQKEAHKVLAQHQVLSLSMRDSKLFAEALINPPEPNEKLRSAFAEHKERVVERK